ncbi:MAG: hypothetical protein ACOYOU_17580 [Kiritimatiellia bacterium]
MPATKPLAGVDRLRVDRLRGGFDFDLHFCHAPAMTSLRQTGFSMISARVGRGRPGLPKSDFLSIIVFVVAKWIRRLTIQIAEWTEIFSSRYFGPMFWLPRAARIFSWRHSAA